MRELRSCLVDLSQGMLRAIAQARGIALSSTGQIDTVRELGDALLRAESVAEALALLTVPERQALDGLLAAGGKMPSALFQQRYGELRVLGDSRLAREKPWIGERTPAEGLWYLGFVCRAFVHAASRLEELVFIPTDLRPLLPQPDSTPLKPTFSPAPAPNSPVDTEDSLAIDVCTLLIQVQNETVRPLKGYRLAPNDSRDLLRRTAFHDSQPGAFEGASDARQAFLLRLVRRARLAHLIEGALKVNPRPARLWLTSSRTRQREALWKAWRDDPGWDDLRAVPSLRFGPDELTHDPLAARRRLLALLGATEMGRWHRVAEVTDSIHAGVPDFLRTGVQYATWRVVDPQGRDLSGLEHWNDVEGALIRYMLLGPLYWLGAVACGWVAAAPAGPAFALTAHGAAWLRHGRDPAGFAPQPLGVAADGTVTSPRQGSLYQRFQLARFAGWVSGGADQTYRLTPQALARAQAQGLSAEATLAFLQRASGHMPEEVGSAVRAWARRQGRVRFRNVTVLTLDSADTLSEVRRLPGVAALLGEMLGPLSVAVDAPHWPELSRILTEHGYL